MLDTLTNTKNLDYFILLGDLFDAQGASVFHEESEHQLENEYEVAANYLEDIRAVLPRKTKLVWTLGNHDFNIKCPDPRRIDKSVRSLCNWNNHAEFGKVFRRWRQIPYIKSKIGTFRLGQCIFYHGFDCGQSSDELEGLQMNYACGSPSWSLMVRGHTHRPTAGIMQARRSAKVLLPQFYCNVGHQRSMDREDFPEFMRRKDSGMWGNAMCIGETQTRITSPNSGKCWDAELLIR